MKNYNYLKNFIISILVMIGLVLLSVVIVSITNDEWPLVIIRIALIADIIYLLYISIKLYENRDKTQKKKKEKYSFWEIISSVSSKSNDENTEQSNKKNKEKKFLYKSSTDRLYDEAVKYYGKYYVMGRSKYEVVEEYLEEIENK